MLKIVVSKYVNFILFLIVSEVSLDNVLLFFLLEKCLQENAKNKCDPTLKSYQKLQYKISIIFIARMSCFRFTEFIKS